MFLIFSATKEGLGPPMKIHSACLEPNFAPALDYKGCQFWSFEVGKGEGGLRRHSSLK